MKLKICGLSRPSEVETCINNGVDFCGFILNFPKSHRYINNELANKLTNLDKKKSRKTKTGWSTDAVVLERLVEEHEIIPFLIKHRTLSKLLSTYIDALPNLISEKTGRVHTNFNQAATATGRLSSCLLYTSPSPRDDELSRMPSSA